MIVGVPFVYVYARRFLYWIQHVLFKKHSILGADFLGVAAYLRK